MMVLDEKRTQNIWFVANTIAHNELKIREVVKKRGFEYFIPSEMKEVERRNGIIEKEIPILSNLIFFKTTYTEANLLFSAYRSRVFGIRGRDKSLITISDTAMIEFITFMDIYTNKVRILSTNYVIGDKMMIKSGVLAGKHGVLTKIDGKNFFTIRVEELFIAAVRILKKDLVKIKPKI